MMSANEISKITVYRLKISNIQDLTLEGFDLVAEDTIRVDQIRCFYRVYFLKQHQKEASWYSVFREILQSNRVEIPKTLTSGFVLLVQHNTSSCYGVVGGVGHLYLKKACEIEPRFGITLAEAILSIPELRGLVQKDTSGEVIYLNRAFRGVYNPHGDVNNLKRVLTNVRGSLRKENEFYEEIGHSIQASDALSVNGRKSFSDILTFLVKVDALWASGARKITIPQLEQINKKSHGEILEQLESRLVQTLCNYSSDETINLFLDNEEIGYLPDRVMKYSLIFARKRYDAESYEDVFNNIRDVLLTVEESKRMSVFQKMYLELTFDDDAIEKRELAYFICGDVVHNNNVYFINNKLWYRASDDYISKLDSELDNIEYIKSEDVELIKWDEQKYTGRRAEQQYNEANSCFVMLDCHLVNIAGQRGGIEFCDLLKNTTGEVQLVHVKHDCGAALRALFAQGYVSAKLYAESEEFRTKVHSGNLTGADASFQKTAKPILSSLGEVHKRKMKVVFAIFDNKESHKVPAAVRETSEYLRGTLTTFAKVDLLERVNAIRGMGYGVAVTRIEPYPSEEG